LIADEVYTRIEEFICAVDRLRQFLWSYRQIEALLAYVDASAFVASIPLSHPEGESARLPDGDDALSDSFPTPVGPLVTPDDEFSDFTANLPDFSDSDDESWDEPGYAASFAAASPPPFRPRGILAAPPPVSSPNPFETPEAEFVPPRSTPFIIPVPLVHHVDPPPQQQRKGRLTDAEMGTILQMHERKKSWAEIGRAIQRGESTCRAFYKNWKSDGTFRRKLGRRKTIPEAVTEMIVAATEEDCRSSDRAVAADVGISPESVRLQRHAQGIHYYKSIPVPPLSALGQETRLAFCRKRLDDRSSFPIVFTDESTVGQDMNKGGIWRRRGRVLPEGVYESEQHPISVMVGGASQTISEVHCSSVQRS
jgi:hypothetical protein